VFLGIQLFDWVFMSVRIFFLSVFFIFLFPITFRGGEAFDHSKWDHILKQYVHDGLVDYKALLQRRAELDDYLKQTETISLEAFSDLSREERIAFWSIFITRAWFA